MLTFFFSFLEVKETVVPAPAVPATKEVPAAKTIIEEPKYEIIKP